MMLTNHEAMEAMAAVRAANPHYKPSDVARAVIEANNAKVLEKVAPLLLVAGEDSSARACMVKPLTNLYSADKVSALIQRNAELEAALSDSARTLSDLPSTNKQGTKTRQLFDRIQSLLKATP